ncbi:MAG: DUF3782 domain-containing protein [Leptospiraceae bacterium]|nr:DUF3782 domain-containing protein [Leptospiraceae bacterium]MCP5512441.1 DUF3782 domain-containing protein [Leptospiraceae bacterium]
MGLPNHILKQFPTKIQPPIQLLGDWIEQNSIPREDFTSLKNILKELAEAQKELAEAQKRTEITMQEGFKRVNDQISALGSRWGIQNENTIRNTISALMEKAGYQVSRGYYGDREVDLVIKNGEHILLEITSSALKKDIHNLNKSAEDYLQKTGVDPRLMIAAVYVSPGVMREIVESPRKIEIFSGEEE